MTLASSTLQIRRPEYSGDINIITLVIFVGICTLPFYAINMDVFSDEKRLSPYDVISEFLAKRKVGHPGESEASQLGWHPNRSSHPLPPFEYVILLKKRKKQQRRINIYRKNKGPK
ncbi:transmembrane protein, putative [Medicago truncatula]|uniref:Transmembrane protein, putative n=1 Tax=Medicago truncatula TaxID=3880 RepID=G7KSX9_MEDTR|nr:transmembrane protein, putative [Medicago truncatula]